MYRVTWEDLATRQLLEQTAQANPNMQQSVIQASLEIEAILTNDAEHAGESREPGIRVLIVNPLTVQYHVNIRNQEAIVISAKIHQRPSS